MNKMELTIREEIILLALARACHWTYGKKCKNVPIPAVRSKLPFPQRGRINLSKTINSLIKKGLAQSHVARKTYCLTYLGFQIAEELG